MPTIEVINKDGNWEAFVMTHSMLKATGKNRSEAIGSLIEGHPELFNVFQIIERPRASKDESAKLNTQLIKAEANLGLT
jgi:hypothetical protein